MGGGGGSVKGGGGGSVKGGGGGRKSVKGGGEGREGEGRVKGGGKSAYNHESYVHSATPQLSPLPALMFTTCSSIRWASHCSWSRACVRNTCPVLATSFVVT